ncbi:MAG: hypothetical protein RLZZ296_1852, partial [Pseudomonadota bacterium]
MLPTFSKTVGVNCVLCLKASALLQRVFKLSQFFSNSCVFFRLGFVVYPLKRGFFQV